ncbi:MAG: LuxR family transcriptional regulator [Pantoea sp.]|uniref:helix-turn-helix transcriptional regulator n=1 Tax=Pantoea TaxID=53335 RepID=UPI00257E121F|nr:MULTISPECIES: LuxR family transcriptional regulator [Pantoea]MDU1573948.1 LuxR family transcriptional regulator [Pantoea sp.]MDU5472124.1 LuxR family transcriptional regulator [Pantoea sp.]MDU6078946.1 LuxR family transcriptional regulator [Pantoea sp.]MDU7836826.1 LuxR family transcriptional regulator [Pantoea sp.]
MRNITREDLCCASCKYGCQLINRNNEVINRCPIQKIAIWPDGNHYLKKGVLSLVAGRYETVFCKGCIFVDFSVHRLRYFTNNNWLDYLKSTGLSIIIVSDRPMGPLAAYWGKNGSVYSVIYCGISIEKIKKQINFYYYGLKGGVASKKVNALSREEVIFLDLAVNGYSLSLIAKKMNLDVKKIYNIKESVRRKTGRSLNQLLSG